MAGPYYFVDDGSGVWDNTDTANWSASDGGATGAGPPLVTDTVNFTNASAGAGYTVTMGTGGACLDLNMAAPASGTITWAGSANMAINGNVSLLSGMTATYSGTITWGGGTSNTWTSNTATIAAGLLAGAGTSWQFLDALTTTGAVTYAAVGTFDLNGQIITCGTWAGSSGNARTITAGGGKVVITGNAATVINVNNVNNLTLTNGLTFELTYAGSTGTRTVTWGTLNGTEARAINVSVMAGTDSFACNSAHIRNLDFTGFAGTWSAATTLTIYGNYVAAAGMTISHVANLAFRSTATGKTITSNGKAFPAGVTFNGVGGEWTLQDDYASVGTTTLTNGSIVIGANDFTPFNFSSDNANARTIVFSSGGRLITTATSGTVLDFTDTTNLTITRSGGTIEIGGNTTNVRNMDLGAGISWPAITFTNTTANGGLDIVSSGAATVIKSIAYTGGTAQTIRRTAGTTITIEDNDGLPSGTAGNVLTIGSITAAQHTWAKSGGGTVNVDYVTISNSNAEPANTFFAGANSIDGGGNTGWTFANAAVVDTGQTPAGKRIPERRRRCLIEIDGQDLVFDSVEDILAYLATHKGEIKAKATKRAEKQAKRILKTGNVEAEARNSVFKVDVSREIKGDARIQEAIKVIEQSYRMALATALARDAEEWEDIKEIARLLD